MQPANLRTSFPLFQKLARALVGAACAVVLSGCFTWRGSDGTRHTLVVGIGVVSQQGDDGGPQITETRTLGVTARLDAGPSGFAVGYQDRHEVLVPKDWQGHFTFTNDPTIKLEITSPGENHPTK